jgi:Cof subfamily protein (haloacid dehalogenase superfamily)
MKTHTREAFTMRYLIFLDIDGTVLTHKGLHPRTKQSMEDAITAGHIVMLNTGRARGNIPDSFLVQLPISGLVAGLGSYILYNGEVLYSRALTDEEIVLTMRVADEYDVTMVGEGEDTCFDYHGTWYSPKGNEVTSLTDLHERFPNMRVSKVGYRHPLCTAATTALSTLFTVYNHPDYAELVPHGHSKATAMQFLQKYFSVDRDHVIAMGDSLNDVEMLQAAGVAVVMGNGHPDVKPLADMITPDACEGGVGYAIEKLVLEKK